MYNYVPWKTPEEPLTTATIRCCSPRSGSAMTKNREEMNFARFFKLDEVGIVTAHGQDVG